MKKLLKTFTLGDWFMIIVNILFILALLSLHFIKSPFYQSALPVPVVNAYESRGYEYCFNPIICIRDVGEELNIPNQEIMEMVRIARAESGFNPEAKNPRSTATGVYQILIGTWKGNMCRGDRSDFEDNIRCAYRIRTNQGNGAWNESRGVWDR